MRHAELSGDGTGTAAENQGGTAAWSATDFKFFPGNAMLDAGAEGLGSGFFSSKAGSKTLSKAGSGAAIGYFLIGEHAFKEALAVAFDGTRDARNFDEVDAGSDQHDATVAQGESISSMPDKTC